MNVSIFIPTRKAQCLLCFIMKYNFYILLRKKGPTKAKVPKPHKSRNVCLKLLSNF